MKKICFVCMGNTCRSPMAEKIFNDLYKKSGMKGLKAVSAGLDCANGNNMELKAKRALKSIGFACGAKKTTRLETLEPNALYITMTKQLKHAINKPSVLCFEDFGGNDIEDPYGGGQDVYDNCAKQILQNVQLLIERLKKLSN